MKQRSTQTLYHYWNELRGTRLAPDRFDVDPSRLSPILSETFILEKAENRAYTFRLAGTRICDHWGYELRGRELHELFLEEDHVVLEHHMAQVTEHGAVAHLEIVAKGPDGREATFEVLILPLIHGRDTVSRYLGVITPIDNPPWLGTMPLTPAGLLEHKLIWPDGRPHALIERANRQAPFVPAMNTARLVRFDRRQFRVLDGGLKKP